MLSDGTTNCNDCNDCALVSLVIVFLCICGCFGCCTAGRVVHAQDFVVDADAPKGIEADLSDYFVGRDPTLPFLIVDVVCTQLFWGGSLFETSCF